MANEPLSYAQSLRVIGQDLAKFRLNSFALEKSGHEYAVRIEQTALLEKLSQPKGFLKTIVEKFRSSDNSLNESPKLLRFTNAEILWSDTQRRAKRCEPHGMPTHNLSVILRALGNYLDKKRAGDFAIWWSTYAAKVKYDHNEEYFTTDNLHDLGVNMYLKRVTRQ